MTIDTDTLHPKPLSAVTMPSASHDQDFAAVRTHGGELNGPNQKTLSGL